MSKKVDLLRASWLSNQVGPSRTLNRIINNKDYYLKRGYEVEVYTMDIISPRNINSFKNAHKSWKYKIKTLIKSVCKKSSFFCGKIVDRETFYYGKSLVKYYLQLNRNADIIVFHDFFSCYYYFKLVEKKQRAKTVLFYHNNGAAFDAILYYYPILKKSNYLNKLLTRERELITELNKIVFIANYGRKNFLSIYPDFDKSKTITIHNGIDDLPDSCLNKFKVEGFDYYLCCAGTINERKGQHLILQALAEISKDLLKRIHVTFIGDGPKREELERFVNNYGLVDNVSFLGTVDNKNVYHYLNRSNIFILMSYEEGLPISIIEALRSGLAIISTRISGIPELVIDGKNGFLIDPDKNQLIDVLNKLSDTDLSLFGKYSRCLFETEYTFNQMMSSYCNMLDSLNHK